MKLSKDYKYTVLCEDVQTRNFIYSFLTEQGVSNRKIRFLKVPAEKGCGEAFVRNQYTQEVLNLKMKGYDRNTLIVCMDADNHTIQEREKYLDLELSKNERLQSIDRRKEFILLWIPKSVVRQIK